MSFCVRWDGSFNLDDKGFAKVNGVYTLEAKMTSASQDGNNLESILTYPGEGQFPIKVDVLDIHSIASTPTVIGNVPAFPVRVDYKLSKSAYVTMIAHRGAPKCPPTLDENFAGSNNTYSPHPTTLGCAPDNEARLVIWNQQRWGEDTTQGKLGIQEYWDGRDNQGALVRPGVYTIQLFAWDPNSSDETHAVPHDQTLAPEFSITIDPLQVTNVIVQSLGTTSTGYAGVNFTLTEAANAYFNIWVPSTTFPWINPVTEVFIPIADTAECTGDASYNDGAKCLVRGYENFFQGKQAVSMLWDGRDRGGRYVEDGDYIFTIHAKITQEGDNFNSFSTMYSGTKQGVLAVARGLTPTSQIEVLTTSFSSPPIVGVEPYYFRYSLGREALARLKVIAPRGQVMGRDLGTCNINGGCTVATIVNNEVRPGGALIMDPPTGGWDGKTRGCGFNACGGAVPVNIDGIRLASGVYLAQLEAIDPIFPNRVSTITSQFLVDQLRVGGITTSPILSGSTDSATISYVLSEPMDIVWSIYPPTTTFTGSWPDLGPSNTPIRRIFGPRPGRLSITEYWDGRNENTLYVQDGTYISVLKATDTFGNSATDPVIKELIVARGAVNILNAQVTPSFPETSGSSDTINIPLAPFEIGYMLSRDAIVTVTVRHQNGTHIATLVDKEPRTGLINNKEYWDGTNFGGVRLTTASVVIDVLAEDLFSVNSSSRVAPLQVSVDLLRIYDVAFSPMLPENDSASVVYQLSEPMSVDLKIYKPGTQFNLAGSPVPAESESLVFRIKGPRPSRVPITELWEGVNSYQKQVADGNYVFRVTATDDRGNIASDIVTGELSILRLGFANPQATFSDQTFAYPNPVSEAPLRICTMVPIDSNLGLTLYTLSGELAWSRDVGYVSGGTSLCGSSAIQWDLNNSYGKRVARGVYFYILRAESVGGAVQALQTRKKLLVK
ncbi:MAG: hypothetical protein AABZ44_01705 [Elusimicrobiota bacterium]